VLFLVLIQIKSFDPKEMLPVMIERSSNQSAVTRPLRFCTTTGSGSSGIQPICSLDNFEGLDMSDFTGAVTLLELDECAITEISTLPYEYESLKNIN
jgi:hypothetical protein